MAVQKIVDKHNLFSRSGVNSFGPESDVDLILVQETDKEFHHRCLDFGLLDEIIPRLDLRIYTPSEFLEMKERANSGNGFWKKIFAEGVAIPLTD
jgi:predicted nucleotidyltransferase